MGLEKLPPSPIEKLILNQLVLSLTAHTWVLQNCMSFIPKMKPITLTELKMQLRSEQLVRGRHEEFISSRFFVTNMTPLLCNGCLPSCAVVFTINAWTGANSKRANEASHARRC